MIWFDETHVSFVCITILILIQNCVWKNSASSADRLAMDVELRMGLWVRVMGGVVNR